MHALLCMCSLLETCDAFVLQYGRSLGAERAFCSAPPRKRAGRPAQVATTVLAIQQQLPRARVVYCSATGVSEARAPAPDAVLPMRGWRAWGAGERGGLPPAPAACHACVSLTGGTDAETYSPLVGQSIGDVLMSCWLPAAACAPPGARAAARRLTRGAAARWATWRTCAAWACGPRLCVQGLRGWARLCPLSPYMS